MLSRHKRQKGTAGFSLAEALVALAIAALLASAINRFVSSTRFNARNVREEVALELASDDLLGHLAAGKLVPGRTDGHSGSVTWRLDIAPIVFSANAEVVSEKQPAPAGNSQPATVGSSPETTWSPYYVVAIVKTPSGRSYAVDTIRIVPRRPEGSSEQTDKH
jgi:prepilin-type N-terminal cleavage/methylation domain-containing protein